MATYHFDLTVTGKATVQIEASSREEALEEIRASLEESNGNFGALPCGSPIIGSVCLSQSPQLVDVDGDGVSECQNCSGRWAEEELKEVKHLTLRVAPGEPMPSGECPECGALCQPVEVIDG